MNTVLELERDEFEQWKSDPVTQAFFLGLRKWASDEKIRVLEAYWDMGNVQNAVEITEFKSKAKTVEDVANQASEMTHDDLMRQLGHPDYQNEEEGFGQNDEE